jgi:hypothetical protein
MAFRNKAGQKASYLLAKDQDGGDLDKAKNRLEKQGWNEGLDQELKMDGKMITPAAGKLLSKDSFKKKEDKDNKDNPESDDKK